MDQPTETFIISGVQENGKKLRPTDWVERLSSTLASVDAKNRLHYSLSAQPCLIDAEKMFSRSPLSRTKQPSRL